MLEILGFVGGAVFGFACFSLVLLPLFYGVPMSIYYVSKGLLRSTAILFYLGSVLLWSVIFFVIALVIVWYFPRAHAFLANNNGLFWGQWFGIIGCVFRVLTKAGRADMRVDFGDVMKRFIKTNVTGG